MLASGCAKMQDAAVKQKASNDLKKLCEMYGDYYTHRERGPSRIEDLEPLTVGDPEAQAVYEAVKAGVYVLQYNVDVHGVAKTKAGMSHTVLGYEGKVPTSGGMVLMVDGAVYEMKPAVFAKEVKGGVATRSTASAPGDH